MSEGPLSGIKILEFGQNLAGPYCGQILTFLGATVVKIERPEGDDARRWGPPFIDDDNSPAVAFVALRLIFHVVLPFLNQPDWLTLIVVLVFFSWGLSIKNTVCL